MAHEPVMSEIQKISRSEELTQKEVHQFWVESTNDFFSEKKTGIDISHRQDNYWKFLDQWEKEIIVENMPDGLTLDLGGPVEGGSQIVGGEARALPPGSTLDAAAGRFYWQAPVGFLGPFSLRHVDV